MSTSVRGGRRRPTRPFEPRQSQLSRLSALSQWSQWSQWSPSNEDGTTSSAVRSGVRVVLLAALLGAAAFNLWLAWQLIGRPDETRYGEAILYDHAARLFPRGEPLYQPLDGPPYTIATYTPLYYWLAAGLHALFGAGFLPGRLVSLGSGLLIACMVGWLVWRRTRSRTFSATSAVGFIALGLGGIVPWTAAYKEDLLGVALCVASLVALDGFGTHRRGVVAAAALAALAALTKQSLLGPALAGFVWLLSRREPRKAALFAVTFGGLVLGSAALLELSTHAFIANVVGGNLHQPFDPLTFEVNLRELATFQWAPLVLALASLPRLWTSDSSGRLLLLSWLGALVPMLALGAIGADSNYWLQLAAVTSVLMSLWLWRYRQHWWGVVGTLLLVLNVTLATSGVMGWLRQRPNFLQTGPSVEQPFNALVARVRSEQGTVLADPLDVLVLADRPVLLEPIVYSLREQDGSWDPRPLVERVCSGEVTLVVLGYPPEEMAQRFPRAVAEAVQQRFSQSQQSAQVGGARRWVLVPRLGSVCS